MYFTIQSHLQFNELYVVFPISSTQIIPCNTIIKTKNLMQFELDKLKVVPLMDQLKHINHYIDYIFRGDDPEDYLEAVFPDLYEVYLLNKAFQETQNSTTELALSSYILHNINNIAKELRSIRKEVIPLFSNNKTNEDNT